MENDFEILSAFLDSLGPEVSGHSAGPVSDEERALIERFAQGNLSESERASIVSTLVQNETALQMLVESVHRN